ncbi:hypothetical protein N8464_00315 [bacterium]|jgi:hypothetical protein|nr:hypothetical protein [bacterium]|tara:strand:+ start:657 stop:827 length:171 start_codon:yes stop_codon:yes gene_type:complete
MKLKEEDITLKYLNKKQESMMSATFASIGEFEERLKNLEVKLIELTNKLNENKNSN